MIYEVKEKNKTFSVVYYKHHWVRIPLLNTIKSNEAENSKISLGFTNLEKRDASKLWDKIFESAKEEIDPEVMPGSTLKEICYRVNLPIAWVTHRFVRTLNKRQKFNRREDRKIEYISSKKFKKTITKLNKINKRSAIIIKILWWINRRIGKLGLFVTLESVLRLTIENIAPEGGYSNWIHIMRSGSNNVDVLPKYLWISLNNQINQNSPFIFSNKDGAPLLPNQINRHLKIAAKKAGIDETITSNAIRPKFNKQKSIKIAKRHYVDAEVKCHLNEVKADQWKKLCNHIPQIQQKKGCKSKYNQHVVLNAVLYWQRTKCSIRDLPSWAPYWRAVHSQYRRWIKNGIWIQIVDFLK